MLLVGSSTLPELLWSTRFNSGRIFDAVSMGMVAVVEERRVVEMASLKAFTRMMSSASRILSSGGSSVCGGST